MYDIFDKDTTSKGELRKIY